MAFLLVVFEVFAVTSAFVCGCVVGSLLNVCIYRLPLEKSIVWPNSRCMSCLHPLKGYTNVPILGYLWLRGRCAYCGANYSSRYMWIELFTGCLFAGWFYLRVYLNIHDTPFGNRVAWQVGNAGMPWQHILAYLKDVILISLLIVASFCDIDHRWIPFSVTLPGTAIGIAFSTFLPWPWPNTNADIAKLMAEPDWAPVGQPLLDIPIGSMIWPFWGPPPLEPNGILLGFTTAFLGAAIGMAFVRIVRRLFTMVLGQEPLGLGDADLMMMVGAFLGWQVTVIGFFIGCFAALIISVPVALRKGTKAFPFGPGLAIGTIATWWGWHWIGPKVQPILMNAFMLITLGAIMVVGILVIGGLFGLRRGGEEAKG